MALRINQNTAAINAHRNLAGTDSALAKSIERLSSGFRVNRASDDPAGLVISEKLRAQIGGLGQAISNSQDAVNVVRTAEAALTEVHQILRSMRDLAVHSSNTGTNDNASVAADQAQIESAIDTLNRISQSTQFGTRQLLDGTSGVNASISDTTNIKSVVVGNEVPTGFMDVNVTAVGTKATIAGATTYATITAAITTTGTVLLNGVKIDVSSGDTVQGLVEKINNANTGVTASFNAVSFKIELKQNDFGSYKSIDFSESSSIINGNAATTVTGADAAATITYGDGSTEVLVGAGMQLRGSDGLAITLTDGATIANINNGAYVNDDSMKFQVGAFAAQVTTVSIQSTAANNLGVSATGLVNKSWTVASINVTTFDGAQDAMKLLDAAITEVSDRRSNLGAFQKNVLESNINSLSITKENIAASESSIRDTDMAAEMVTFTRNQVLMQAGTAMLTQANQAPQALLSLLR